jgi:hypothetical protein
MISAKFPCTWDRCITLFLFSNLLSSETQYRDTYPKEHVLIFSPSTESCSDYQQAGTSKQKTDLEEKSYVAIACCSHYKSSSNFFVYVHVVPRGVHRVYAASYTNQIHEMLTSLLWLSGVQNFFLNRYTKLIIYSQLLFSLFKLI